MTTPGGVSAFDIEKFGRWLTKHRDAEGLLIKDIAAMTGISSSVIQAMVSGRSPTRDRKTPGYDPSITVLVKLAQGLGFDLAYILERGGIDVMGHRAQLYNTREQRLLYRAIGTAQADHSRVFFPLELESLATLQGEFAASLKPRINQQEEDADA